MAGTRAGPPKYGWVDSRDPSHYFPGLDGLRALAVASVFCYHLGPSWAGGGYLGVDVFFVISGYLITGILLGQAHRGGTIPLRSFWARRARRLLPALLLMLVATSVAASFDHAHLDLRAFRWDAIATLFYAANWHQIFAHQSYFAQFASPSPLTHTWSLAIEEQFYLVWPLVALGSIALSKRPGRVATAQPRPKTALFLFSVAGAGASVIAMGLAYHGQSDTTSVYFSTQTRAFELLVGAAMAIVLFDRSPTAARFRVPLEIAGLGAIGGFALLWSRAAGPAPWMYRGGFLLACILAAVVIAVASQRNPGPLGRALGLPPLRYLGRISYGIYLWHWPAIVFLTPAMTGMNGTVLDLLRGGVTLGVSAASYHAIEAPLRRASYSGWKRRSLVPASALLAVGVILIATLPTAQTATASTGHQNSTATVGGSKGPASVAGGPYPFVPAQPIALGTSVNSPKGSTPTYPTPSNPLRMMVVGDSVMWTEVPAFVAAMQATGVVVVDNAAIPGWGLTTAHNWPTVVPQLIAQYRPQIVVGTWSWDNTMAADHPAAFRALLDKFVNVLMAPGNGVRGVIFFQFPPLGPLWSIAPDASRQNAERPVGVKAWDTQAAAVARSHPGRMMFLEVAPSVEVKGKFSAWLPNGTGGWRRARMVDNTHFCPWGAAVYAAAVVTSLAPIFHLTGPAGRWWSGAWTTDSRYGDPPGACPDDQPPATSH